MTENITSFGEILEAADKLPLIDQESLVDILQKRIIDRRRGRLAEEIRESRKEYEAGTCRESTPKDIMDELLA